MRRLLNLSFLLALCGLAGCATRPAEPAAGSDAAPVLQRNFVYELLRHVYLWNFDESFFIGHGMAADETLEVWMREVPVELDPGDQSRFAEVWLPQIKLLIELKKADYAVPELNLRVENDSFKITRVTRVEEPADPEARYQIQRYPLAEVKEYLLRTRDQKRFPDEVLRRNMRQALVDQAYERIGDIVGAQVFYAAPISPVSNELWVYHDNRRRLVRFSADMDLSNPGLWKSVPLHVRVYNLETDVIVSRDEGAGNGGFLTKDFAGRALFNCQILGQRHELSEAEAKAVLQQAVLDRKSDR